VKYAEGIQEFIDRCNAVMPPDFFHQSIDEQRRMYHDLIHEFFYDLPSGVSISDETISHTGNKYKIRTYKPNTIEGDGLIIYIRGGGFVVGSLETHNTVVAELCKKSGLMTIAIDFRMSPEYPFPAAIEDCYGALCGIASLPDKFGINPEKIVISGDSSGANMAVVVAMMSRDRMGPKICGQGLISPVLDFTRWSKGGIDAPLLTGGEMEYYTACYVPDANKVTHPYVSPLIIGKFNGLPPAYIMGAEMDSLLADSEEYARCLRKEGIKVKLMVEQGLIHSAIRARGISPQVSDAWDRFCREVAHLAF
jgi:acetyl esterase